MALEEQVKKLVEEVGALRSEVDSLKKRAAPDLASELEEKVRRARPWYVQELHDLLDRVMKSEERFKDSITVLAGLYRGKAGAAVWSSVESVDKVLTIAHEKVAEYFAPLTSAQRLNILSILISGLKSESELSELTGLQGGSLHHHLEELMKQAYIRRTERGQYQLHPRGWTVYITACQIAASLTELTPEKFKWPDER